MHDLCHIGEDVSAPSCMSLSPPRSLACRNREAGTILKGEDNILK